MIRSHRDAFSLIEIMIAVAVIGIMTATITRVMVRKPVDDWGTVHQSLSITVAQAQQAALLSQKVHRIAIISLPRGGGTFTIESEEKNPEKPLTFLYKPATNLRAENPYMLPNSFEIRAVFVKGVSQLNDRSSNASFHVTKEGIVDPTVLHIVRIKDEKEESRKTFIVQPFLGRCDIQDGFIKP